MLFLNRKENYNARPFNRWAYWNLIAKLIEITTPAPLREVYGPKETTMWAQNYNSRHSARNYFRQSNNISVCDITTPAHVGIKKTKSTKERCDYNSRSSTRNSSVSCKRFEMPKRRCDYNSFQSYHERYWIAPENLPKHFFKSFVYYNARHSGAGLFLFFETYRDVSLRRLYHTFPFLTNAFSGISL